MPRQPLIDSYLGFPALGGVGRIGNQLWQVASTVGLARRYSLRPVFPAGWAYRPFLSCPDEWFSDSLAGVRTSDALAVELDPRARPYLQDYGLWAEVDDEIRAAFTAVDGAVDIIDREWDETLADLPGPVCAVHVRRGDYATNPAGTLTSLKLDYYLRALDTLQPGTVAVFSDEPDWCEEHLPFVPDVVYHGVTRPKEQEPGYATAPVLDWIDIYLMARCDQHVISNSTYAWWAAWLADDRETRFPSAWAGYEWVDWRRMILDGWVEVEAEC